MVWFVIGCILAVIAAGCFLAAHYAKKTQNRSSEEVSPVGFRVAGAIVGILAVLFLGFGTTREVPAREVGVPVVFGHVGTSMNPGLHFFQNPATTVNLINERYQTVYYHGKNCLSVRLGGQQVACWQGSIQYKVLDQAAPQLFNDYGNTGNIDAEIQNHVVTRQLQAVLTRQFGDYNPITDAAQSATRATSQFTQMLPKIVASLNHNIGGRVKIESLLQSPMIYSKVTQANLERIQQQTARTQVADQQYNTNIAVNRAFSKLSSASLSPSALTYECYQTVQEAMQNRYQLPAGFSCTGGSNVSVLGVTHK